MLNFKDNKGLNYGGVKFKRSDLLGDMVGLTQCVQKVFSPPQVFFFFFFIFCHVSAEGAAHRAQGQGCFKAQI